jgi:hypothetical protein
MREKAKPFPAVFLVVLIAMAAPAVAQPPLVSSPTNGTLGLDPATSLTLAWTTVPNANTYVVELSESPSFQPLLPLKDAEVAAQAGRLGQSYLVQFTDNTALQAGRKYHWRVSAVVNGARVTSDPATFTTASDPFGWLVARNFSLTRSEDGVDKDKPATIGFIRQGGGTPSQQVVAEFLLGWEGDARFVPRQGALALSPSLAFAGKMSSDKEAEDTLAKVAGGLVADWSFGQATARSLYQRLDVAYEGDQAFDEADLLVEYLITYSGPGVGRFYPASAAAPVQILVRPYLLAAYAKQLDAPTSMPDGVRTRIAPQIDVKVRLNMLARALGISGSLLALTDRWYSLSGYTRNDANYFTASLDFLIAKGFTFGYAYKRGRDVPVFKGVNRMALTVGLGFGG